MKWEHRNEVLMVDGRAREKQLDEYGFCGWEMVSAVPTEKGIHAFFKRPVTEHPVVYGGDGPRGDDTATSHQPPATSPVNEIMLALNAFKYGSHASERGRQVVMNGVDQLAFRSVVEAILAKHDRLVGGAVNDISVLALLAADQLPWKVKYRSQLHVDRPFAAFATKNGAEAYINLSRDPSQFTIVPPPQPKTTSVATMPVPPSREDEAVINRFPKPEAPGPRPNGALQPPEETEGP